MYQHASNDANRHEKKASALLFEKIYIHTHTHRKKIITVHEKTAGIYTVMTQYNQKILREIDMII